MSCESFRIVKALSACDARKKNLREDKENHTKTRRIGQNDRLYVEISLGIGSVLKVMRRPSKRKCLKVKRIG